MKLPILKVFSVCFVRYRHKQLPKIHTHTIPGYTGISCGMARATTRKSVHQAIVVNCDTSAQDLQDIATATWRLHRHLGTLPLQTLQVPTPTLVSWKKRISCSRTAHTDEGQKQRRRRDSGLILTPTQLPTNLFPPHPVPWRGRAS